MQLILYNEFYKDNKDEIISAAFIRAEEREEIVLSFKNEWIEIHIKNSEEEEIITGIKYILFLRFDIFYLLLNNNIKKLNL